VPSTRRTAHSFHLGGHHLGDLRHLKNSLEGMEDYTLELTRHPCGLFDGRQLANHCGLSLLPDLCIQNLASQISSLPEFLCILVSPASGGFTLRELEDLPDVGQIPLTTVVRLEGLPVDGDYVAGVLVFDVAVHCLFSFW